jgi:hypothetical protein
MSTASMLTVLENTGPAGAREADPGPGRRHAAIAVLSFADQSPPTSAVTAGGKRDYRDRWIRRSAARRPELLSRPRPAPGPIRPDHRLPCGSFVGPTCGFWAGQVPSTDSRCAIVSLDRRGGWSTADRNDRRPTGRIAPFNRPSGRQDARRGAFGGRTEGSEVPSARSLPGHPRRSCGSSP